MEFYCADIEMLMSGWNTLYLHTTAHRLLKRTPQCVQKSTTSQCGFDDREAVDPRLFDG
jgi:hypothetical protein